MTDVAKLAGVSHQTVSRVLNNSPQVRAETRDRVLAAMTELDYRPNAMARGLASRRTNKLGVVTFDTILYGPASTLLGIERAARDAGYGVSIAALERLDHTEVLSAVDALDLQGVDGIIILAPYVTAAEALQDLPSRLPAVAVEAPGDSPLPSVSVDQVRGAALAVRHLLDLGHRSVWHVGGPQDWHEARDRITGWHDTLADAGVEPPPVIDGDWSAHSGYQAGLRLAERRGVTAVFAANDQQALGLLRALHERGIRVPDDISVVGFDDIPESGFLLPPLTTVRQDFDEVGRRAMATLLALLDDGTAEPAAPVLPTLVVRHSTAAP